MFHHVVLIKFKQPLSQADRSYIDGECARMRISIPGLQQLLFVDNVAERSRGYTHAFVSTLNDAAAHDVYQAHESHQDLKRFMGAHAAEVLVLDHEF